MPASTLAGVYMERHSITIRKRSNMKELYVCEKCGRYHKSWDAAYACEESHYDNFEVVSNDYTYNEGSKVPSSVILKAKCYINGEYKTSFFKAFTIRPLRGDLLEKLEFEQVVEEAYNDNYWFDSRKEMAALKAGGANA
jgi:hypothetical protein